MIIKEFGAVMLIVIAGVAAQAKPCKKQPVKEMVEAVAEAFVEKKMGALDPVRPHVGSIRIVIEHSLADDDDPQSLSHSR